MPALRLIETEEFTIRPIEESDDSRMYVAVRSNSERLEQDFPNVVKRYSDNVGVVTAVKRAASQTADETSGYNVFVATDPDNLKILGIATTFTLGKRAMTFLDINRNETSEFSKTRGNLVAGWTIADHPKGLALAGLRLVCDLPRNLVVCDTVHTNYTFIRDDNMVAQKVAEAAGLKPQDAFPMRISPFRQRLAGLGDGTWRARRVWHDDKELYPSKPR